MSSDAHRGWSGKKFEGLHFNAFYQTVKIGTQMIFTSVDTLVYLAPLVDSTLLEAYATTKEKGGYTLLQSIAPTAGNQSAEYSYKLLHL